MSDQANKDLVFLKPNTDNGLNLFAGSVKVNVPNADMSRAIRLLRMPQITVRNEADKSRTKSRSSGNPEFFHVECETVIDKSTISAFNCVTAGSNIGDVTIYQMTTGGGQIKILSQTTLSNTFITEVRIKFDIAHDEATAEGLVATYILAYDKLTQIRNIFDEKDQGVGKHGSELNRNDQVSESAGG
jgi:type VI protein secretion system component Hcp